MPDKFTACRALSASAKNLVSSSRICCFTVCCSDWIPVNGENSTLLNIQPTANIIPSRLILFCLRPFDLLPFHLLITAWCRFAYSHFAYLLPLGAVSPTHANVTKTMWNSWNNSLFTPVGEMAPIQYKYPSQKHKEDDAPQNKSWYTHYSYTWGIVCTTLRWLDIKEYYLPCSQLPPQPLWHTVHLLLPTHYYTVCDLKFQYVYVEPNNKTSVYPNATKWCGLTMWLMQTEKHHNIWSTAYSVES